MWNSANKKQRIKLLTEVSGYMPPGHLSALVRLAWFPRMCHDTAGLRVVVACLQVRVVPYPDHQEALHRDAFRWGRRGRQRPRCWMSSPGARPWAPSPARSSLPARRARAPSCGATRATWSNLVRARAAAVLQPAPMHACMPRLSAGSNDHAGWTACNIHEQPRAAGRWCKEELSGWHASLCNTLLGSLEGPEAARRS